MGHDGEWVFQCFPAIFFWGKEIKFKTPLDLAMEQNWSSTFPAYVSFFAVGHAAKPQEPENNKPKPSIPKEKPKARL